MHRLRHAWPLGGVLLAFLIGLAVAGVGGSVLCGTLSVLVFGPAYLVQNTIRYHRGTLPTPPGRTPEEQARFDRRVGRLYAFSEVILAGVVILLIAIGRPGWLSNSAWTPSFLLAAVMGITGAPYIWAVAEQRATGRSLRWAWALTGALDAAFGSAAIVVALTNQLNHWIGGSIWTIVFAFAAALWLVGAPGAFSLARR